MKHYDYLIVGAGLFGSVFARNAMDCGKSVLVIEKREHIAGNIYSERRDGIDVHMYGPHIFHTNNERVWNFLNRFAEFNNFIYTPIANYKGSLYNLPFNMNTFNKLWHVVTPKEAEEKLQEQRSEIKVLPSNLEQQAISLVGRDIFEKLVKGYTEKQWGRNCSELPPFIIKRLPVRLSFSNNYFDAKYQGIPIGGYTEMIGKMLDGIEVRLSTDYLKDKECFDDLADNVIYTGPIDAFYKFQHGALEYRSLRFETEKLNMDNFQGCAGMNYTDRETPWTRIIEHKWFVFGKDEFGKPIPGTIITREYSAEWEPGDEPYYPLNNERNNQLYNRYQEMAKREKKVKFGGRLGQYKYYDMDQVVAAALEMWNDSMQIDK